MKAKGNLTAFRLGVPQQLLSSHCSCYHPSQWGLLLPRLVWGERAQERLSDLPSIIGRVRGGQSPACSLASPLPQGRAAPRMDLL